MQSFASFRNRHNGETVLVCGCGESLNQLNNPGQFLTIGVNDVGRRFQPDYLVVVNPRNQFKGDRFHYVENSQAKYIFTQLELGLGLSKIVKFRLGQFGGTDVSNPEVLHYTRNSPYVAVCLAVHMGTRRIGLLGVDFTDHHFFAKTGHHHLTDSLERINEEYRKLGAALASRGIELVNLSHQSRLTGLERAPLREFAEGRAHGADSSTDQMRLRVVSYATTPIAGVPAILARCIATKTCHASRCVWSTRTYGNGVSFEGGMEWVAHPQEALEELQAADVVIVHNGKVDPRHERILANKPVITLAHNYMWNVDRRFERQGMPALVVGQYQATLPEFAGWNVVPNPVPIWEPSYTPGEKADVVTICYTPSGRHERYPSGHRLYWHGKGYDTTMRVLDLLAATLPVRLEVVRDGQVAHGEALKMKRRAHIVIDECVTGSYHRNSLEGLAAGCVVVNGVGLLPAVAEVLQRCAPGSIGAPFVFATLETLEDVLRELIASGPQALADGGQANRAWMERHWEFAGQWQRFWQPAIEMALDTGFPRPQKPPREEMNTVIDDKVSVIVPHGGRERLPLLAATLASLRQAPAAGEVIVVEMGVSPLSAEIAARWDCRYLFIEHTGPFERARALNAGTSIASHEIVVWHDNDVLHAQTFLGSAASELRARRLDFLLPYSVVHYLGETDSLGVLRGERNPADAVPANSMRSGAWVGCIGIVRREFVRSHGGLIEGFLGWGGEDDAWFHKAALCGSVAGTAQSDQRVYHLYHPLSGGLAPGQPGAANAHYSGNVERLRQVRAARSASELAERFTPPPPTPGHLTEAAPARLAESDGLASWIYWEGPCPAWIRACRRTIAEHAPRLRVLTPESFDRLRDTDRDIDLSRLHVAHRADYIRTFLLWRYGGLWIDADCLVMQPLQPLLDLLAQHDFLGHRERVGLISNGFIAARPGSRIAASFYARVCETLRSRRPLPWNGIGADPLTALVANDARGWHEIPCERVQPVCWSHPEEFFALRAHEEHERVFDPQAICYMLSNNAVKNYLKAHGRPDLLDERSFFSFLLRRALGRVDDHSAEGYEDVFATHAELYLSHRCESVSGPGSSLTATQELRARLPVLLEDLAARTLLDAPCGDMHWMQRVHLGLDEYVGVDIIGENIANNQWRYETPRRRFIRADVIRDPLPQCDAIFCRDLLTHFSFSEIARVLANFKKSGSTYLLTTTFIGPRPNHDTSGGIWRTLNLTLPPFSFPDPLRVINEKCVEGGGAFRDKSIGVWRLRDLPTALGG